MIERIKSAASSLVVRRTQQPVAQTQVDPTSSNPEPREELPATDLAVQHSAKVTTASEHYASIIRFAISQGGKIGNYSAPVDWLRTTLAGLEGNEPGVEGSPADGTKPDGIPNG